MPMQPHAALILVDVQPDFMPGGALACHEGDAIVPGVSELLGRRIFQHVVATQDWHPRGHVSFAGMHEGAQPFQQIPLYGHAQTLWPDHCVQGTSGAALHPHVDWSAADLILRKGSRPDVDSYSAFRENYGPHGERPSTGLSGWLHERGVKDVYVAGLARDVCVLWTAQDAAASGFRTYVLWDLTRPVTPESDTATRAALQTAGIGIVESAAQLR
jgi:nicotinamidase/pyrazinamidase